MNKETLLKLIEQNKPKIANYDVLNLKVCNTQSIVFQEYQKNGYHSLWTDGFKNNNTREKIYDIAEFGLITTEVSEGIEELRNLNTNDDMLFLECADIVIRVMNFMSRKGANLAYYILLKNEINKQREKLHGREI